MVIKEGPPQVQTRRKKGEAQREVLEFLLDHPDEDLTVDIIAAATGLSYRTVNNIVNASSTLPVYFSGNRRIRLTPNAFDRDDVEGPWERFPYGDQSEFYCQGSLSPEAGGPGKVASHPTADEQELAIYEGLAEKEQGRREGLNVFNALKSLGFYIE